jgi:ABC-type antimicrobial peptide transport system permease subunit
MMTMRERLNESLGQRRLGAALLGSFGALGLLLSLVGVYGVVSETVARRRREVGIRFALGATPVRVIGGILGQAALLALLGVGGASLALLVVTPGAERLFPGMTVGASRIGTAGALLTGAVLLAALAPALRAARTDVVRVLTEE